MSFQPPPEGANPPPPPPPPGQWGPPQGGGYPAQRPGFDPKTVNPLDWAILGVGFVLFIFSFFEYYSWSIGPFSESWGAWHFSHGLFVAWFAMIVGVAAAVVVALDLFVPTFKVGIGNRVLALWLFAASFLLYIIAIFAHDDFGPGGGHGFSFWLSLILAAGGGVLTLMRLQQTGGQLPGAFSRVPNIGHYGPQGGLGGNQQTGYPAGQPGGYAGPPPTPPVPPAAGEGTNPPAPGAGYGPPPTP